MQQRKKLEKLEKQKTSANRRAKAARDDAKMDRLLSVGTNAAGYQLAKMVNTYIPGPSEKELAEMALKKKSPLASKRVLIPAGVGVGLAAFGGDSMLVRVLTLVCGAVAGANATGTAIKLGQVDSAVFAQAAEKK